MEKTKAMLAEAMRENESLKQSLQQQIEQTLLSQKLLAVSKQREISSDPKSPPNTAKADSQTQSTSHTSTVQSQKVEEESKTGNSGKNKAENSPLSVFDDSPTVVNAKEVVMTASEFVPITESQRIVDSASDVSVTTPQSSRLRNKGPKFKAQCEKKYGKNTSLIKGVENPIAHSFNKNGKK